MAKSFLFAALLFVALSAAVLADEAKVDEAAETSEWEQLLSKWLAGVESDKASAQDTRVLWWLRNAVSSDQQRASRKVDFAQDAAQDARVLWWLRNAVSSDQQRASRGYDPKYTN